MDIKSQISYDDFEKVDIRVGIIKKVEDFKEARVPSYKLEIDLGELGIKRSSAHITNYSKDKLVGMSVICVVNFKPKQVANFMSEVLVLGVLSNNGVILLTPEAPEKVEPGQRIA
ncbi:MAG: tRNA-binding protein [Candidatus Micrarchaeia archaeon]